MNRGGVRVIGVQIAGAVNVRLGRFEVDSLERFDRREPVKKWIFRIKPHAFLDIATEQSPFLESQRVAGRHHPGGRVFWISRSKEFDVGTRLSGFPQFQQCRGPVKMSLGVLGVTLKRSGRLAFQSFRISGVGQQAQRDHGVREWSFGI